MKVYNGIFYKINVKPRWGVVIRDFVMMKLAGDTARFYAMDRMMHYGESPSVVANRLNVSRYLVRGWYQRMMEHVAESMGRAERIAVPVYSKYREKIRRLNPIVADGICLRCGIIVENPYSHLIKRHRDDVCRAIEEITGGEVRCI